MSADVTGPTPYPEVNAVLQLLLEEVRAVLSEQFVGLYVRGSLASGGFQPGRSDVDFLVITAGVLRDETISALEAMHGRVAGSGLRWATRLEGSYIPQHALRCCDLADARHPALRMDGSFGVNQCDSEWIIQRHLIREHAIVLAVPSLRALIDPVPADDLRRGSCASGGRRSCTTIPGCAAASTRPTPC